jgi:shikimate kinase
LTDHADQRAEIAEVLNLRTKLYADAATIVIDTDGLDGDSVIEAVYKEVTQALGYGDDS